MILDEMKKLIALFRYALLYQVNLALKVVKSN